MKMCLVHYYLWVNTETACFWRSCVAVKTSDKTVNRCSKFVVYESRNKEHGWEYRLLYDNDDDDDDDVVSEAK